MSTSLADLLASQLPHGIARHAQALLQAQAALERTLPAALTGHVRVTQLDNGVLSLACDSGAVASRLRHQTDALIEQLQQQSLAVSSVRVSVNPELSARYSPVVEKAGLSDATLNGLAHLNDEIEAGPLKDALDQLLRHHRRG